MSTINAPTRPTSRWMLTGVAWLYVLLTVPVLTLFVLEVVFIPLTLLTVGLFALMVIVPGVAGVATAHRRLAEVVLGEPVPESYRPVDKTGIFGRLQTWASDPARWKDLAWMFVASTLGFTMA